MRQTLSDQPEGQHVFSILDSVAGVVRSYRFDTRQPDSPVVRFDEMPLA
jgi:hypothetical protein